MSKAGKSCRHSGAVGSKPTRVTRHLMDNYGPEVGKVLDFGSGKVPRQTELLRQAGFDVHATDLPENHVIGVHATPRAVYIDTAWDVVLVSNVLNVQASPDRAAELIANLIRVKKPRVIIFNLPNAPVHWTEPGIVEHIGPGGRRRLLDDRLMGALRAKDYRMMQKHPYSGGVVYVIDNGQDLKEQPQIRGCMFPTRG